MHRLLQWQRKSTQLIRMAKAQTNRKGAEVVAGGVAKGLQGVVAKGLPGVVVKWLPGVVERAVAGVAM